MISKISRTLAGAAVATALIAGPMMVLAHDGNDFDSQGAHKTGSQLSVQINDNGTATVRGAKVAAINGAVVSVATSFGSTTVNWNVTTSGSTKFVDKGGRNSNLASLHVGDILSFSGAVDPNASTLTVLATTVKDWSVDNKILDKHTFEGKLQAAIGTTSLPTSFNLTVDGTAYLVKVAAGTPVLAKNWATTNLGTFLAGDTVRVYGSVEASSTSIIDAVVVRNATR